VIDGVRFVTRSRRHFITALTAALLPPPILPNRLGLHTLAENLFSYPNFAMRPVFGLRLARGRGHVLVGAEAAGRQFQEVVRE
jgi:hypothetical protein